MNCWKKSFYLKKWIRIKLGTSVGVAPLEAKKAFCKNQKRLIYRSEFKIRSEIYLHGDHPNTKEHFLVKNSKPKIRTVWWVWKSSKSHSATKNPKDKKSSDKKSKTQMYVWFHTVKWKGKSFKRDPLTTFGTRISGESLMNGLSRCELCGLEETSMY